MSKTKYKNLYWTTFALFLAVAMTVFTVESYNDNKDSFKWLLCLLLTHLNLELLRIYNKKLAAQS